MSDKLVKNFGSVESLLTAFVGPLKPKQESIEKKAVDVSDKIEKIKESVKEKLSVSEIENTINKLNKDEVLNESSVLEAIDSEGRYKLYRDKEETFECNISVQGTTLSSASVRLVFESETWNVFFTGKISDDGKCLVPLKKMSIFEEGHSGKARLEVVIDDALFVPWEQPFIVEATKKIDVQVKVNKTVSIS